MTLRREDTERSSHPRRHVQQCWCRASARASAKQDWLERLARETVGVLTHGCSTRGQATCCFWRLAVCRQGRVIPFPPGCGRSLNTLLITKDTEAKYKTPPIYMIQYKQANMIPHQSTVSVWSTGCLSGSVAVTLCFARPAS